MSKLRHRSEAEGDLVRSSARSRTAPSGHQGNHRFASAASNPPPLIARRVSLPDSSLRVRRVDEVLRNVALASRHVDPSSPCSFKNYTDRRIAGRRSRASDHEIAALLRNSWCPHPRVNTPRCGMFRARIAVRRSRVPASDLSDTGTNRHTPKQPGIVRRRDPSFFSGTRECAGEPTTPLATHAWRSRGRNSVATASQRLSQQRQQRRNNGRQQRRNNGPNSGRQQRSPTASQQRPQQRCERGCVQRDYRPTIPCSIIARPTSPRRCSSSRSVSRER